MKENRNVNTRKVDVGIYCETERTNERHTHELDQWDLVCLLKKFSAIDDLGYKKLGRKTQV